MKKIYLLPFIILSIFITSCEDVIDVEINDEDLDLIAVNAKLTTIENPVVVLSKSLPVTTAETNPALSGAAITISDDMTPANTITLVEDEQTPGYYTVPDGESYLGFAGRTYTLTIKTQNDVITATERLARVEKIDTMIVRPSDRGQKQFLAVYISSQEPKGLGDFYKWDIYVNDTLFSDFSDLFFTNDVGVDGNYVNELEIYTDFHNTNEPNERTLKFNSTVRVHQTSITESAYNFYWMAQNQAFSGGLFSVPPANVKSNLISANGNTVLGLFAVEDVSISNEVLIDQSIEDQIEEAPDFF